MNREQRKKLFIETKAKNEMLTIALLSQVCGRTNKQIEGYLYADNRYPSMWDMHLLREFTRHANASLNIEINRALNRETARAKYMGKKYKSSNEVWDLYGDRMQTQYAKYIYRSKSMTVPKISGLSGICTRTIYDRIQEHDLSPGDDITQFIYRKKSGRPQTSGIKKAPTCEA